MSNTLFSVTASFHWSPFVKGFVCSKHSVKFMYRSNHTQPCRSKKVLSFRHKHDCTTNWNKLVTFNIILNWLQITGKGWLGFPSACHCHGQLQTLQQLSVHVSTLFGYLQGDVSRKGTFGEVGIVHIISTVKPTRCTTVSNLFYFWMTHYMFRTVFPSIIRSSRVYIQQQAFVKQILLSAC